MTLQLHAYMPYAVAGERATALRHVALCEGGDEARTPHPFLALASASSVGEDYPSLGRLLLFQVGRDSSFRLDGGGAVRVSARLVRREKRVALNCVQ